MNFWSVTFLSCWSTWKKKNNNLLHFDWRAERKAALHSILLFDSTLLSLRMMLNLQFNFAFLFWLNVVKKCSNVFLFQLFPNDYIDAGSLNLTTITRQSLAFKMKWHTRIRTKTRMFLNMWLTGSNATDKFAISHSKTSDAIVHTVN